MAYCPSCGTENSGEARFCRNCGKTMDAIPAPAVESDPVTGIPTSAVGASRSSSAVLVIGLVLVLVATAAAGGYYFLAGPGSSQGEKAASAPPPAVAQKTEPIPEPQPVAPPVQANIAEPPAMAPPVDMTPPAPPPVDMAPPMPKPVPPKPRRNTQNESAFFAEGNPPMESMPPPGLMVDPNGGRWLRMRDEMYRCGYESYCQERVRQRYCAGYWGRVPDCVRAPGYPPY
jgi:zinc-ribbon domain